MSRGHAPAAEHRSDAAKLGLEFDFRQLLAVKQPWQVLNGTAGISESGQGRRRTRYAQ